MFITDAYKKNKKSFILITGGLILATALAVKITSDRYYNQHLLNEKNSADFEEGFINNETSDETTSKDF